MSGGTRQLVGKMLFRENIWKHRCQGLFLLHAARAKRPFRGQDTGPLRWKRPLQALCAAILRTTLKLSRPPPPRGSCNSLCPAPGKPPQDPIPIAHTTPAGAEPDRGSVPHQWRTTGLQTVKCPPDHRGVSRLLSTQVS